MTLTVSSRLDRVLLIPSGRCRDLILSPDEARRVAALVRASAAECAGWVKAGGRREILTGEGRGAVVKSWDGRVNVRLATPTDRESVPYEAALKLADEIEAKATEAECRVSIVWTPAETLP